MTTKELAKRIGKTTWLDIEMMFVNVKIEDARVNFGRVEYHVTPTDGTGHQWVTAARTTLGRKTSKQRI